MKENNFKSQNDTSFLSLEIHVSMSDNDEIGEELMNQSRILSFL